MCKEQKEKPSLSHESMKAEHLPGKSDFFWSDSDEPHAQRRKEILKKYPQIKELYGHDPNSKYKVLLLIAIQTTIASQMSMASWTVFFLTAYVIGGTCNHMLLLACHELSHNLMFKKMIHNRVFSLIANWPVGLPTAISFKRYHLDHHRYQGMDEIDVDIPTAAEGRFFQNTISKLFFVIFQVVFYAIRPLIVNPKIPTVWEYINWVSAISFDAVVFALWGQSALAYLLLSSFLGAGLHPVAGHFIAEHYVFEKGTETYSYYGPLNIFAFNVGYHNEHHDFPFIAGSRLPEVRAIAPEYYDNLPQCKSWSGVLYDYITDPEVTAFSRVKRSLGKTGLAELKSKLKSQ